MTGDPPTVAGPPPSGRDDASPDPDGPLVPDGPRRHAGAAGSVAGGGAAGGEPPEAEDAGVPSDEDGPERAAGRDGSDPEGAAPTKAGGRRRAAAQPGTRGRRVAGIVAFVYVVWTILGLVLLDRDPSAYNALNRAAGNLGARLVLAGVLLALVVHLVDGLRVALVDLVPRLRRHDLGLRTIASFLVPALWIPATVVLLWPAVRGWFSW